MYRRPLLALVVAGAGVVMTAVVILLHRAGSLPGWWGQLIQLVVVSAPALAAFVVAIRWCARREAVGQLLQWRWRDVGVGFAAALVLRALQEVLAPTTGSLLAGFGAASTLTLAVIVVGAVAVTPVVEELFFRGVLLAALLDAPPHRRRGAVVVVAVVVSAIVFAGLHVLPFGVPGTSLWPGILGPLLVGLGCGVLFVLTRRLAAGIVTHVVFNASGMLLLLT